MGGSLHRSIENFTMQTIYRTNPASNFTVFSNELITNSLPAIAYRVLCYMLSRPPHWKKNNADIAKKLSLSAYAVKQALRQIRLAAVSYTHLRAHETRHDL